MLNEILCVRQERSNVHDHYAIAALKSHKEQVVGHLLREISRFMWFIINLGVVVSVRILDVNHRRSLVQGGLEIPIGIVIPHSDVNKRALETYATLISKHYEEPVNGKFADATANILARMASSTDESDTDMEGQDEVGVT